MVANVFVIGLDEFNREQLATVHNASAYRFHSLIPYSEIVGPPRYDIDRYFDIAHRELADFGDSVDAIIGHWDFPTTSLVPLLGREYGLAGSSPESVLKCEHKYWSRVVQQEVLPESTPAFQVVDPFDPQAADKIRLKPPYWLKPVIGFSSYLAFRIRSRRDLDNALARTRKGIGKFAEPYERILERAGKADVPHDYHGGLCVAEQTISGRQCTVEGYVLNGKAHGYAVIDSIRGPNRTSFARYQYPSTLPPAVRADIVDRAERVAEHIGLDNTPFNIEFFWHRTDGRVWLLEINPRISKSHCPLFELVDGASHHEVAIEVALGRHPNFPRGDGSYTHAVKFMPRLYHDATVTRCPTAGDIARARRLCPSLRVDVHVHEGMRLSELRNQDSYSYEIGDIFLGAHSQRGLLEDLATVMRVLDFRFDSGRRPLKANFHAAGRVNSAA